SGCFVELGAFKPFQRVSAFSRCSCTTLSRSMLMAGKSLYRDGQFEEAIVVLDELIDRYPTSGYLAEARRVRRLAEEARDGAGGRSEEHTSELQSRENLVCRLLVEKKNKKAFK